MLVSTCQDSTYATDISWCSTTSHIRFVGRRVKEREKNMWREEGEKERERGRGGDREKRWGVKRGRKERERGR